MPNTSEICKRNISRIAKLPYLKSELQKCLLYKGKKEERKVEVEVVEVVDVDQVDEVNEVVEVLEVDEVDEVVEDVEVDDVDEVDEVDETDEVDEVLLSDMIYLFLSDLIIIPI